MRCATQLSDHQLSKQHIHRLAIRQLPRLDCLIRGEDALHGPLQPGEGVPVGLVDQLRRGPLLDVELPGDFRGLDALRLQRFDLNDQPILPGNHPQQAQRLLTVGIQRVLHQPARRRRIAHPERIHQLEDIGCARGRHELPDVGTRDRPLFARVVGQLAQLLVDLPQLIADEVGQVGDGVRVELNLAETRPRPDPVRKLVALWIQTDNDARTPIALKLQ